MKTILAILCLIMLLFGGGCAIALGGYGGGGLVLIPLAVAALNALLLVAIFGWGEPWRPAFYTLAAIDLAIVPATLIGLSTMTASDLSSMLPWAVALMAGFALKGVLTWRYARERRAGDKG